MRWLQSKGAALGGMNGDFAKERLFDSKSWNGLWICGSWNRNQNWKTSPSDARKVFWRTGRRIVLLELTIIPCSVPFSSGRFFTSTVWWPVFTDIHPWYWSSESLATSDHVSWRCPIPFVARILSSKSFLVGCDGLLPFGRKYVTYERLSDC